MRYKKVKEEKVKENEDGKTLLRSNKITQQTKQRKSRKKKVVQRDTKKVLQK